MNDKRLKAAIYSRLSDEDKNKTSQNDISASIKNQNAMLMEYAIEKGFEVYNIYTDDDYTGADRNRPAFKKLLTDAKERKFDVILCKTQSRFTRELEVVEKYIHNLFPLWGIRFIGIVDNADTEVKANKKSRQINGLINEWYLEDLSENIKSVLTSRRKQGFHIGAYTAYGYKKNPDKKGHLIIDDEAALVVKEIFTLYSIGYGKTAIAKILNEREIPNPTEYKRLKGIKHKAPQTQLGKYWKYSSISNILANEVYIGHMVQGKYESTSYKTHVNKPVPKERWIRVENTHEPIIDTDLWDAVQSKINSNFKPFDTGKIGIFAKKVRCEHCGYIMRSGKSRDKRYLKCSSRHIAKDACKGSFIFYEKLEQIILAELNFLIGNHLDLDEFTCKIVIGNDICEIIEKTRLETLEYEKKSLEYSKGIKELYIDKVKGIINEADFINLSKDFNLGRSHLEKLIGAKRKEIQELEIKLESCTNKETIIQQYTNIDKIDRDIIEVLIDTIYISKRDKDTDKLIVDIHWNF